MPEVVAKILGLDFELANFFLNATAIGGCLDAAQALLGEIRGFPLRTHWGTSIESGRRYLATCGGSAYIDSSHLELCTPEHASAAEHVVQVHAGLALARRAQQAAQRRLQPRLGRLEVLANNCDGHVSYGSHLNVLTTARCFSDILFRKPHAGAFLASHLVTSIPYTGQGMVGSANGRPACDYQLSARADWYEEFANRETMQRRPLLNQRDEPHAAGGLARLHIIFFDFTLAPVACFLRAGVTQLIVAMCEAGWIDPTLALDDPVGAAADVSRDLSLQQTFATTVRGRRLTAIELQQGLCDLAGEFVDSGAAEPAIPEAREILRVWRETLDLLRRREIEALALRCDNWLKYLLLERQRSACGLTWQSPALKVLDLRYASLDPVGGLFWNVARTGCLEMWPDDEAVQQRQQEPPGETRAYARAHLLRRFGNAVAGLDWSWIEFRVGPRRGWCSSARLEMNDPRRFNRAECSDLFARQPDLAEVVAELSSECLSSVES